MTYEVDLAKVGVGCLTILGVAMVLCLFRLTRGPTLADRVAALELIALTLMAAGAVHAVLARNAIWLDLSIVAVIVGFLGTTAVALYLLRRQ